MTLTVEQLVRKAYPNAGCELSAMRGFRVMDYTNQQYPEPLGNGCKTERAAWISAARRLAKRSR